MYMHVKEIVYRTEVNKLDGEYLQSQKSDSGRPSVSPTRGEHGSGDGQGGSELSFKPSLLEEILTEKKLVCELFHIL